MKIKVKREISKKEKISEEKIVEIILEERGIKKKESFLNPSHPFETKTTSLFSKKEIQTTIKKLEEIKKKNEMIVVYTDYDADGICGGAIVWEVLYQLGFKVMPYVPDRITEGYGFSKTGIEKIKKLYNPSLIISVDHGIAAEEKIKYAKKLGMEVIVTDHHLLPKNPSKSSLAIFHNEKLAGAAVAYFFSKMIFENFSNKNYLVKEKFFSDYLVFAAIGTIADLVPLLEESRSIAWHGLKVINKIRRIGLHCLFKKAGILNRLITPFEISYIIAPRINALGRLDNALDALRLLCTKKEERAQKLAIKIEEKNRLRQNILEKAVKQAKESIKKQFVFLPKILILESEEWHEGIIGLIAAKICEEFYRPTIVVTHKEKIIKGSARSIDGVDITQFLQNFSSFFLSLGGHPMAAGFSVEKKMWQEIKKEIYKLAEKLISNKTLEREIVADLKLPLVYATDNLVSFLEKLEPFGVGNPRPLFLSEAKINQAFVFGEKNRHLKLFVEDDTNSLELVFFEEGEKINQLRRGKNLQFLYYLENNRFWQNLKKIRGKGKFLFF